MPINSIASIKWVNSLKNLNYQEEDLLQDRRFLGACLAQDLKLGRESYKKRSRERFRTKGSDTIWQDLQEHMRAPKMVVYG